MSDTSDVSSAGAMPRYTVSGDSRLADYYPAWLDNLADDVTVEGSMIDGVVQGADPVRSIVVGIRALYGDTQQFHSAGPYGDNEWIEDYIAEVEGNPLGVSSWSPATRPDRHSTSWPATDHAARWCASLNCWAKSSLERLWRSTSSLRHGRCQGGP